MPGTRTIDQQIKVLGVLDREEFIYNSPRSSRHAIDRRRYLPLGRVYRPMSGAKLLNPWPLRRADIIHAWSRVPLGPTPFLVGFGWRLPLTWEHSPRSFALLMDTLLSSRCRRIIASSQAAASAMLHRHEKHAGYEELRAKTIVRLPNADIPKMHDWFDRSAQLDQLRLVFVGDHFARKGGCVAVKLAEMAHRKNLPIHVTIVSSLTCGVWTDPTRPGFFDPYLKLLDLPNVTLIKSLPAAARINLVANSHLLLMPTLGDSLDYTVVEGMARFTPAIVTATCAFPEFVDADSGVLLPVETNCQGEWKYAGAAGRDEPEFERVFTATIDRLTDEAFAACAQLLQNPGRLGALRQGARRNAEARFDAKDASRFWDETYVEALNAR